MLFPFGHGLRYTSGPALGIGSPADGDRVGTDTVLVTGTVSHPDGVRAVTINGRRSTVGANGAFSGRALLVNGANVITVVATGNDASVATKTVIVTSVQSAPILTDPAPASDVTLASGDTVVLRFTSAPDLNARYQVLLSGTPGVYTGKGMAQGTAMTEVSPGVYEATYTAPANVSFTAAYVRFSVNDEFNNLTMVTAPGRLTVVGP